MRNKRGWIRIVEAFVTVLLITGVLLVVINKGYFGKEDVSDKIYSIENSVLREIELDDELRKEILAPDEENLPINWENGLFPENVKNKITESIANYDFLDCEGKICKMNEICVLDKYPDKDIYAQSIAITATLQDIEGEKGRYSPRQLRLFCRVV